MVIRVACFVSLLWFVVGAKGADPTAVGDGAVIDGAENEKVGTTGLTRSELDYWKMRTDAAIGSEEKRLALADELSKRYPDGGGPEVIQMLRAIAEGSMMGPNDGWFGPGEGKFDWDWLAKVCSIGQASGIEAAQFKGPQFWFERLDRDGDGRITQADLDWSPQSEWVKNANVLNQLFRLVDQDGDNRATIQELTVFSDSLRGDRVGFSAEDLRDFLLRGRNSYLEGDAPTPDRLLQGLFNSEVGSMHEGVRVGEKAPNFTLKTHDQTRSMTLAEKVGDQPVVLVFGNFTCGPFRRNLPEVEDLYQRYQGVATFIGIYVREAHPSDGWIMASNTNRGVLFAQPKTFEERVAIAKTCHAKLNYTMPLLVDTIDDAVGNAYSGMPARLYVIDRSGVVTYKGGRGPFGFKVGEMEQALLLTLLAEKSKEPSSESSKVE